MKSLKPSTSFPFGFVAVVACGDNEIDAPIRRHFDARLGSRVNYFCLGELGGVKNLLSPPKDEFREYVLQKIRDVYAVFLKRRGGKIPVKLNPSGLVILVNHSHCGKYSLDGIDFDDERQEEAFHTGELQKAEKVIKQTFPGINTEYHYFLKEEQRFAW